MNELERLIAPVRPEPSDRLDKAVDALLAQQHERRPSPRWKSALAELGTAACVGLLGFYWSRQSVTGTVNSVQTAIKGPASDPPPESAAAAAQVVSIPLREDQLAAVFMPTSEGASLPPLNQVRIACMSRD